ncbi:DUF488 domain-containing protein [Paramicrobacterium agarici]|uniref:DUF488 domain-containing protein n=1 Tax=Paramicrobacterium agarici TaxID=630514 RepID=UPI00116933B6|nr:DUF488 domain-containing protein [Microbacterium agarici]TQO22655.1 uncharacterized protein DUF488 [Microbacterium agarici]
MPDAPIASPVFTVGHSDRTLEEFTRMLHEHDVRHIVDVRKLAGSRKYPHFNDDALSESLPSAGIAYSRIEELAGRRPVSKDVPFEVNAFWNNRSFHNYADYALSESFRNGLDQLHALAAEATVAVMCSEAVWWRCHRRIIADHLLAHGDTVRHIMTETKADAASLTLGAVTHPDHSLTYPPTAR